jgi:4'-phosphopantetheinyl transferase
MDVGVDIEAIRATTEIDGIAARFMSPAEQCALAAVPPAQRLAALFQCWTRKEAFVKGIGTGLSFPLRDVDVWYGSREPATVSGWSVHQVDVAPGLAAAVAGASLGDWVPAVLRRLGASIPHHSYQPSPGSPAGLAAPGG